jgi:hypothetical protein
MITVAHSVELCEKLFLLKDDFFFIFAASAQQLIITSDIFHRNAVPAIKMSSVARGDIHQQFAKCSLTYSYLSSRGLGAGGGAHPSCCPHPLTLPYRYTLLYICIVHELCSRTVGEYYLRWPKFRPISSKGAGEKKSCPEEFVAEFCQKGPKKFLKEFPSVTEMINTQRQ